jgi:hypothetical protein
MESSSGLITKVNPNHWFWIAHFDSSDDNVRGLNKDWCFGSIKSWTGWMMSGIDVVFNFGLMICSDFLSDRFFWCLVYSKSTVRDCSCRLIVGVLFIFTPRPLWRLNLDQSSQKKKYGGKHSVNYIFKPLFIFVIGSSQTILKISSQWNVLAVYSTLVSIYSWNGPFCCFVNKIMFCQS